SQALNMRTVRYAIFFFSSRRRHTSFSRDWSSDVCSSDLALEAAEGRPWSVLDARFVRPLDREAVLEAAACGALLTVEEGVAGGRSEERRVGKECRGRWAATRDRKRG